MIRFQLIVKVIPARIVRDCSVARRVLQVTTQKLGAPFCRDSPGNISKIVYFYYAPNLPFEDFQGESFSAPSLPLKNFQGESLHKLNESNNQHTQQDSPPIRVGCLNLHDSISINSQSDPSKDRSELLRSTASPAVTVQKLGALFCRDSPGK